MTLPKHSLVLTFVCNIILPIIFPAGFAKVLNPASSSILVDPEVLESPGSSVFLTMSNTTDHILNQMNLLTFPSDAKKAFALVTALEAHALVTQADIQQFLTLAGVKFTPFWITNQIHIQDAFPELLFSVMDLFPGQIAQISREILLDMLPTFDDAQGSKPEADSMPWNLKMMGADIAHSNNMKGQGVRVAVLDTGVADHEELKGKVVNWKDFTSPTDLGQLDTNGHGTHVCGTIAGTTVGMAPLAEILACKCCDTAGCLQNALLGCAQHICCPNPGCSLKPHIASCSWGGSGGQTFYEQPVKTWQALNIVPMFALGNSGPNCNTAGSPGDYSQVMGIAAMTSSKSMASFSSRGPSTLPPSSNVKPDLTAPGEKINSCSHLGKKSYRELSGTSMACPHMSGAAAVLQSNGKLLSFENLKSILVASSSHDLVSTGTTCGGKSDTTFPNFISGFGSPNLGKAIAILQQQEQQAQQQAQKEKKASISNDKNKEFDDFETESNAAEDLKEFVDFDTMSEEVDSVKVKIFTSEE